MDEPAPPSPRSRDSARLVQAGADAAAFAMLALTAVALGLFAARRDIARELAQDWLAERGIESGFTIESVDSGAFVGRVRLGPTRDPVFSAERVEVAYDLTPPWAGGPFKLTTRAVRLVRPRLKVSWDGTRFSAGALDPLIADFLARPKTGEPGPAVLVEDAFATVVTPEGPLRLTGDAALDDGELLRFDGALLPARLTNGAFVLETEGGTARLRKAGRRLTADVRLQLDYSGNGVDFDGGEAAIEGTLPYPDLRTRTLAGPLSLHTALRGERLAVDGATLAEPEANFRIAGQVGGDFTRPALTGRITGAARAAALSAGQARAQALRTTFDLGKASVTRGGLAASGRMDARANSVGSGDLVLTAASAGGDVGLQAGEGGFALAADADVRGSGALPRRMAEAIPVLSEDPRQLAAMAQTFTLHAPRLRLTAGKGQTALALGAPATLASAPGGRIVVSPRGGPLLADGAGAFDLAVSGGGLPQVQAQVTSYSIRDGLDARLALKAAFDAPPAQDAAVDVAGRLRMAGGRTSFVLAGCGQASAALVDFGDIDAADVDARVCPAGEPLVSAGGGAWRVAGRFEQLKAEAPSLAMQASDAAGAFAMGGRGRLDAATVEVQRAALADAQAPRRFNPVWASGRLALSGGVWRGAFPVASGSGRPVGTIGLTHDLASRRGRLDIDARALAFKPDGLQPAELSPLAEAVRNADGAAAFTGQIAWTAAGTTSGGELDVPNLAFASPAGMVTGLKAHVVFTSLAPLVSAPGQTVSLAKIDALTPLEGVAGTFALSGDSLRLDALSARAAKGQVSLEPTVVPFDGGPVSGVLVLDDVDVGEIVAASTLAQKVKVQAVVDGRLPFAFGPEGLRFKDGRVAAVKPGRIAIDRTALSNVKADGAVAPNPMDAAPAPGEVNAIQDFAYQAMENLSFDTLEAEVNSVDEGRLAVLFRIKGRHDPAVAEQARVGLADLLSGRALKRRIPLPKGTPVDLTLDTSLNFDQLLDDWRRRWSRSDTVQPQEPKE